MEIERSVLGRQALFKRFPYSENTKDDAEQEASALLTDRTTAWSRTGNEERKTIDWQFTTEKARTKFSRHYPTPSP